MERIYSVTGLTSLLRQYWLLACFLLVAAVLLVGVRLNSESYHFGVYSTDEYHTVYQGLNLMVNGQVDNFRAEEGVRWLVRAFYPYALVSMNTHMGGNVYIDGWEYPGHNYIVKNFIKQDIAFENFSADPNLRSFFHALRVPYIGFVFVSILALLLFFFRQNYLLVGFGGVLLLGLSTDLLVEQNIFYIEPGMLAFLALFILGYCYFVYREYISDKAAVWLGVLGAWVISTKFSVIFFLLLPLVLFFYFADIKTAFRQLGLYVGSLVASYVVINFPAFLSLQSFNIFLHDLSSNFWQYATGSDSTVAPGVQHLSLLVLQLEGLLGYALYLMPIVILFAFWYANTKEKMLLIPLSVLTLLSIFSLSNQHLYLQRNLVPFLLPIVVISLLSLEIVVRRVATVYGTRRAWSLVGVLALLWAVGIVAHAGGASSFMKAVLPNAKEGFVAELRLREQYNPDTVWYAVDFPNNFFEHESFAQRITMKAGAPSTLNNKSYPVLEDQFNSLSGDAAVLVNNVGTNKHLTHYILPKYFSNNMQFGNYYVFFNSK